MKILIITETFLPATDGIVTRLTHGVDYFCRRGHTVSVLAPNMEGIPKVYKGAKVIPSTSLTFPFYDHRPWGIPGPGIGQVIKEEAPDLVHAVNPIGMAAAGIHYAWKYAVPVVASFHTNIPHYLSHYHLDFLSPFIWSYLRKWHNGVSYNMVTSQAIADLLAANDIPDSIVLFKGVDLENRSPSFASQAMRRRLSKDPNRPKLLIFVGRIAPEKELASLIPWLSQRKDVNLAIVGDGPYLDQVKEAFQGLPATFTGFLHGEDLSQAYASADAFIFPSISETLGLVITEAMASGLPVIAASSEPTLEQIQHGENGLIYDQNDIQALNQALDSLDNPAFRQHLVENGITYAQQFSWDAASQSMLDVYHMAVQKTE